MSKTDVAAAQARATAARSKLADALGDLKSRLAPATLARNAAHGLTDKAQVAAESGIAAAKARPAAAVGLAALAGLFFARKPIVRAFSATKDETPTPPARSRRKTKSKDPS